MFLHFNHEAARCLKTRDAGNDGEYYWTWRVLAGTNSQPSLAQGFSINPEIDEGTRLEEDKDNELGWVQLNDPKFTIELPDVVVGEDGNVRIELFCWEHDKAKDSKAIKQAFTNPALQQLIALHEQQKGDRQTTGERFATWLEEDDISDAVGQVRVAMQDKVKAVAGSVLALNPLAAIASAAVPLLEDVTQLLIRNHNSDDLVGVKQIELFYTQTEAGQYRYRWLRDQGLEPTLTAEQVEQPNPQEFTFRRADGKEVVRSKGFFQIWTTL
ncbi:MAG: hypothetical protein F6J87_14560 [Spirulina sp. SIO3F2]|nr:hypothetical protein [Spirulina sp. SIO3F2]